MTANAQKLPLGEVALFVRKLVETQGDVVLEQWEGVSPLGYKDRRDFVTGVDLKVEDGIKRTIKKEFPKHGFRGEESAAENTNSPYQWLIDPIDGTKYYAAQSSLFSISVGLLYEERPILGVVYSPTSKQCFHAVENGGAFLNEDRVEYRLSRSLDEAIINLDMPHSDSLTDEERAWYEEKLVALTRQVYRIRALGAGALASCWLATGALDAFIDLTGYNKPQDVAAGRMIMTEAGIRVSYIQPSIGPPRLVAAPPTLWPELNQILLTEG